MNSPCPSVAGGVKKVKVAGLLPRREWAVCTEEQEGKALYKRSLCSGPLLPFQGIKPLPEATSGALDTPDKLLRQCDVAVGAEIGAHGPGCVVLSHIKYHSPQM